MKVAVIGAGIAGLGAAWALASRHQVTVFEAGREPGGHAHTRDVVVDGRPLAVDAGFIVFNEPNYPLLGRLFRQLGVRSIASDMSFAVSLDDGRIEYEGSPRGLFAQPGNLFSRAHWRMLADGRRFYREAPRLLADAGDDPTLGELLDRGGYGPAFAERHILPMGAAIWSGTIDDIRDFPARRFVRFFVNHRLFDLRRRPQWRTVAGGSRDYVHRLVRPFAHRIRAGSPVTRLARTGDGVVVSTALSAAERFDSVVLATHADQSLRLLGDGATAAERRLLGAFRYRANRVVMHTDPRLMPRRRNAWASWNYIGGDGGTGLCVSYWMNRLQRLPVSTPVIVTLNPVREPDARSVLFETSFDHPQFDREADAAQAALSTIQGADRLWFCGSWCGDGFHEDGLRAGLAVAEALGAPAPWAQEAGSRQPERRGAVAAAPMAAGG